MIYHKPRNSHCSLFVGEDILSIGSRRKRVDRVVMIKGVFLYEDALSPYLYSLIPS